MSTVMQAVDVDVPVSTAYNQWTQFEEFPKFLSFVESVSQLDATHLRWKTNLGGEREFDTEITEQLPDERIAWKSTGGDVDHAGVVTFHRLNDQQSRVAVQLEWDPEGFVERAGSALGIDERAVAAELDHFRDFIESRGVEEGAWRGEVNP